MNAQDDASVLEQLHHDFVEAFRSNDEGAIGAAFAESAVLLPPRRALISGKTKIVEFWQNLQRVQDLMFESTDVELLGDTVLREAGEIQMTMRGEGRETYNASSKYIAVWTKVGDGWKLDCLIWNGGPQGRQGGGRQRAGARAGGGARAGAGARGGYGQQAAAGAGYGQRAGAPRGGGGGGRRRGQGQGGGGPQGAQGAGGYGAPGGGGRRRGQGGGAQGGGAQGGAGGGMRGGNYGQGGYGQRPADGQGRHQGGGGEYGGGEYGGGGGGGGGFGRRLARNEDEPPMIPRLD